MSFPQLNQLQIPLLACQDKEAAMTRPQPLQFLNNCGNDEELDVPGNDGIFRVMQRNQPIILHEDSINHRDDEDSDFCAANIPRQQQQRWYQQPQQLSAMISNFSTSYNAVNVSLVLPILKVAINQSRTIVSTSGDEMSSSQQNASSFVADAEAAVASSLLAGMMLGQIIGGVLGDLVGPPLALRLVMFLQIVASIGSSCSGLLSLTSISSSSSSLTVYWQLAAWRFILGIGAGGVYPLAAVLSATTQSKDTKQNYSNAMCETDAADTRIDENNKLHRVVLTFSTQGLGFITVPLVAVLLLHLLPNSLDAVWRLMLGFGSIPGFFLLVWQWRSLHSLNDVPTAPTQEERESLNVTTGSTRSAELDINDTHEDDSDGNENGSVLCSLPGLDQVNDDENDDDGERSDRFPPPSPLVVAQSAETKSLWESIRNEENLVCKMLGTGATWFLFDVLFYGNTLFQPIVMEAAFGTSANDDPVHVLQRTARDSLILTSIALPGYIVASVVLGKSSIWCYCGIEQTPRFVMMQGFGAMAILYFAIGSAWDTLRRFPSMLVLLYSLTFFFANFGPNTTTFVLPSLVFSEECRSTFNGLSAAAGKLGALTGATLFEPASDGLGNASVMLLCSLVAVMALILTKCFVPMSTYHGDDNMHRRNHAHTRVPADV